MYPWVLDELKTNQCVLFVLVWSCVYCSPNRSLVACLVLIAIAEHWEEMYTSGSEEVISM